MYHQFKPFARFPSKSKKEPLNIELWQPSPPHDILLIPLDKLKKCAIVNVIDVDSQYSQFDVGSKEERELAGVDNSLKKYYARRHYMFSRFDEGIQLDAESWYSVVAEPVSLWLQERMLNCGLPLETVFEPFSGVGGMAVHLAPVAKKKYHVNDICEDKIRMLRNNFGVYGVSPDKVDVTTQDFLDVKPFPADILLICPPWGGLDLAEYGWRPLDEFMKPQLSKILAHAAKFTKNIMLQMPKNTNLENLFTTVLEHFPGVGTCEIAKILFNGNPSQLFVFVGEEKWVGTAPPKIYDTLYKVFDCKTREDKDELKKWWKEEKGQVLQ